MSKLLKSGGKLKIAGKFTVADWKLRKIKLDPDGKVDDWEKGFEDFFIGRLQTRYFDPIKLLIDNNQKAGEGFAIVALQCSLIEFLASIRLGLNYKHGATKCDIKNCFKYLDSGEIFRNFLVKNTPFKSYFDDCLARDFYKNVRCALLHEARTTGGWKIRVCKKSSVAIKVAEKIIDRNKLQCDFGEYVKSYKKDLLVDKELQVAFIRKFDNLCEE